MEKTLKALYKKFVSEHLRFEIYSGHLTIFIDKLPDGVKWDEYCQEMGLKPNGVHASHIIEYSVPASYNLVVGGHRVWNNPQQLGGSIKIPISLMTAKDELTEYPLYVATMEKPKTAKQILQMPDPLGYIKSIPKSHLPSVSNFTSCRTLIYDHPDVISWLLSGDEPGSVKWILRNPDSAEKRPLNREIYQLIFESVDKDEFIKWLRDRICRNWARYGHEARWWFECAGSQDFSANTGNIRLFSWADSRAQLGITYPESMDKPTINVVDGVLSTTFTHHTFHSIQMSAEDRGLNVTLTKGKQKKTLLIPYPETPK